MPARKSTHPPPQALDLPQLLLPLPTDHQPTTIAMKTTMKISLICLARVHRKMGGHRRKTKKKRRKTMRRRRTTMKMRMMVKKLHLQIWDINANKTPRCQLCLNKDVRKLWWKTMRTMTRILVDRIRALTCCLHRTAIDRRAQISLTMCHH